MYLWVLDAHHLFRCCDFSELKLDKEEEARDGGIGLEEEEARDGGGGMEEEARDGIVRPEEGAGRVPHLPPEIFN